MAIPTSSEGSRRLATLRSRPATAPATSHRPAAQRTVTPADALPVVLALAALACLPMVVRATRLDGMGGLGLATVLPLWAWAAIVLAVVACATEILRARPRSAVLVGTTAVLVLCTTGLPSLVESAARVPSAWVHLGFIEAIVETGQIPSGVDSRFAWPGFFAQWAWLSEASGGLALDGVLRWTPPVVVAVWAVAVHAIARPLLGGVRGPWVAVWLFLGANWIEQDYFSPQATVIVLTLALLACLVGPLATTRGDPAGGTWPVPAPDSPRAPWLRRIVATALLPVRRPDRDVDQVLLTWAVVALCLVTVVIDHPLTPFALGAQLVLLALAGRFWGRWLVVVLVVVELTWFVLGAREFWTSRLDLAIGDLGDLVGALAEALFGRFVGDPGQLVIKAGRVVMALATVALAVAGAWVRRRRNGSWLIALLAAVPAGLVLGQSYGGEILLRVLLYSLPFLAVLGAEAIREAARRRPRAGPVVLTVGLVALFASLVVLRGGNEAYLGVTAREVAVSREVLDAAPPGARILRLANTGPMRLTRAADTVQVGSAPECARLGDDVVGCLRRDRPDIVLVLPSMEAEGVVLHNAPPGWSRAAVNAILATGQYRALRDDGDIVVLGREVPR
ncbi:hypothetical protein [Actinomycetospora aeridis]|uniref:Glycosyltransferase RgtA/B/C/D-like domain-containing protein n=1 Tax=Actinomycetospora aeridis TaxID=3129231 RepID=A0ABU8NE96_9PSEU